MGEWALSKYPRKKGKENAHGNGVRQDKGEWFKKEGWRVFWWRKSILLMNSDFVNAFQKAIWNKSVSSKFKIFSNHGGISLQESNDAYIDMTWSIILENILHKFINPLEVLCVDNFCDNRGMYCAPERGDGSRKGWWKSLHPYVYKVLDPERCGIHTVPQNIRLLYMCCISAYHIFFHKRILKVTKK